MTEFGAVHVATLGSFHGQLFEGSPDPESPEIAVVGKPLASPLTVAQAFAAWLKQICQGEEAVFVSDNPAYDFQWISAMFDIAELPNPFGYSGRRISDFWAGLHGNWSETQGWKRLRRTRHDHNPVNDAMGNAEALRVLLDMEGNAAFTRDR
jgi:hypothetical protein